MKAGTKRRGWLRGFGSLLGLVPQRARTFRRREAPTPDAVAIALWLDAARVGLDFDAGWRAIAAADLERITGPRRARIRECMRRVDLHAKYLQELVEALNLEAAGRTVPKHIGIELLSVIAAGGRVPVNPDEGDHEPCQSAASQD